MKDAHGHGSDPRGGAAAHQQGVQQATAPMQRRQYEAIAGAIKSYGDAHPDQHAELASHFAGALRGTNPNFQPDKFRTAAMTGNMGRTKGASPDMTRQHYEAVANTISAFGHSHPGTQDSLASHFASELGRRNSNFNAERFKKAASR
jgi:hypothetical protein